MGDVVREVFLQFLHRLLSEDDVEKIPEGDAQNEDDDEGCPKDALHLMKHCSIGRLYPKTIGHLIIKVVVIVETFGFLRWDVSRRIADGLYDGGVFSKVHHLDAMRQIDNAPHS